MVRGRLAAARIAGRPLAAAKPRGAGRRAPPGTGPSSPSCSASGSPRSAIPRPRPPRGRGSHVLAGADVTVARRARALGVASAHRRVAARAAGSSASSRRAPGSDDDRRGHDARGVARTHRSRVSRGCDHRARATRRRTRAWLLPPSPRPRRPRPARLATSPRTTGHARPRRAASRACAAPSSVADDEDGMRPSETPWTPASRAAPRRATRPAGRCRGRRRAPPRPGRHDDPTGCT